MQKCNLYEIESMLHISNLACLPLQIDEQMVSYFGRHSAKMFVCSKPIRFGYKNWVLTSSDGYPYKFETCTGACETKDSSKPLGPQVVSALFSIVGNFICHLYHVDTCTCISNHVPPFVNCIEMLTVAVWRLRVTVQT